MLFIEALSKANSQPKTRPLINKRKNRTIISNRDSVALSSAAHQVKEIHLDSREKTPLTPSNSIFANLIEHVINYLTGAKLTLHSPEELNLEQNDWQLFLQVPPVNTENTKKQGSYLVPAIHRQPPAKQLIFHIPVKPAYGKTIEMTLLLSAHHGSPEIPQLFHLFPKENQLPALNTPYTPEFIDQQITHYHVLLDQDGEADQLSPLYSYVNQSRIIDEHASQPLLSGLRIWRAKGNILNPVVLGDNRIGMLFFGHYHPLDSSNISLEERQRQSNKLYTKA
ncbi:hypothetical protein [Marinomonas transparens]|uniref:Uncharacterized protein n=1 Tax=Marinomonas transparens TaxID=2795388 RepID=A0A934JU18_9GAMM|nr:hypothetical protein [Marinomonas transparens]MBJ7537042.1 hypothetical protein [Marinomonas transparens]